MALNPLVSLFGRLVARSGRKRGNRQNDGQTDRQTYRPSTVTLAAHARRGLITVRSLSIAQPGVMVLLTGDGAGYFSGRGFHQTLENIHDKVGWSIEVLAWRESCHKRMMHWVNANWFFLPLEDFYASNHGTMDKTVLRHCNCGA